MLLYKACSPAAVFCEPVVFANNAWVPMAVLSVPPLLSYNARYPTARLLESVTEL